MHIGRRSFVIGLMSATATGAIAFFTTNWRPRTVTLQAALQPATSGVALLFTLGNQQKTAHTGTDGVAVITFRYKPGTATVSGAINGTFVSDSTQVMC